MKKKNNTVSVAICICFAIIVAVIGLNYQTWNNAVQVFNIASEFFCMAVILVVYIWYLRRKITSDTSIAIFSDMCLVIYFAEFADIISWAFDGIKELKVINLIATVVVFILSFVYGVMFIKYMFSYVEEYAQIKTIKKAVYTLIIVLCIIDVALALSGKLFYIKENGTYHTSDLFIVAFITMPIVNIYVCGVVSGYGLSARRIVAFLSYPVLMGFEAAIVALHIDIDNSLMVNTFSLLFIYCANFMDTEVNRNSLDKNIRIYLSEEVASQLSDSGNALEPGGSTVNVSMIFCMLHSFGNELDTMQPEDAVKVLNHFFGEMTDIVAENKGVLLEFPGYGLFCIFGAPNTCRDHAEKAIAAALTLQQKLPEINRWNKEHGYPMIETGIGINTGTILLGSLGNSKGARYTAVGDTVDKTFQIESCSLGGQVLVSNTTLKAVRTEVDHAFMIDYAQNYDQLASMRIYEVYHIGGEWNAGKQRLYAKPDEIITPINVFFRIIIGKHTDVQPHAARVKELSEDGLTMEAGNIVTILDNIRIDVPGYGTIFAKVKEDSGDDIVAYFTSRPEWLKGWVEVNRRKLS